MPGVHSPAHNHVVVTQTYTHIHRHTRTHTHTQKDPPTQSHTQPRIDLTAPSRTARTCGIPCRLGQLANGGLIQGQPLVSGGGQHRGHPSPGCCGHAHAQVHTRTGSHAHTHHTHTTHTSTHTEAQRHRDIETHVHTRAHVHRQGVSIQVHNTAWKCGPLLALRPVCPDHPECPACVCVAAQPLLCRPVSSAARLALQ